MFIQFEELASDELVLVNSDHVAAASLDLDASRPGRVVLTFGGASTSSKSLYFGPADMTESEVATRMRTLHMLLQGKADRWESWTKTGDATLRQNRTKFTR